jgi:hypothetical protein
VQDDEHQDAADAKNRRRNTDYSDAAGGNPPKLDGLPNNRVEMVISESPVPEPVSTLND